MAQEDRKGQSKLIEDGKGLVKGLSITWPKLSWISCILRDNDEGTHLKQGASCSPDQFGSLVTVPDEPFDSLRISGYLESEELRPGSR